VFPAYFFHGGQVKHPEAQATSAQFIKNVVGMMEASMCFEIPQVSPRDAKVEMLL
jgi:hypothetical protein